MQIREYNDSDLLALRALHSAQGFDYAFPDQMVYVEVDGGLYVQGGHVRGWRLSQEHEKHNEAAALGWRGLRTQPKLIRSAQFIDVLRRALGR